MRLRKLAVVGLCALTFFGPALALADSTDSADARVTRAEHAVAARGFSASSLLELGRAQLDAGRIGPAILSFERGLVLAPRDESLGAALARAESAAGVRDEPPAWPVRAINLLSLREWSYAAFAALLLLALSVVGLSLLGRRRRVFSVALALSGVALSIALPGVWITRGALERAFVLADNSVMRQSPFPAARALSSLRAGEFVREIDQHDGFAYVETAQGVAGWVARDNIESLVASGND